MLDKYKINTSCVRSLTEYVPLVIWDNILAEWHALKMKGQK